MQRGSESDDPGKPGQQASSASGQRSLPAQVPYLHDEIVPISEVSVRETEVFLGFMWKHTADAPSPTKQLLNMPLATPRWPLRCMSASAMFLLEYTLFRSHSGTFACSRQVYGPRTKVLSYNFDPKFFSWQHGEASAEQVSSLEQFMATLSPQLSQQSSHVLGECFERERVSIF